MLFDDKYAEDYDIDFTGENTFIAGSSDTLMKTAPAKLALLGAEKQRLLVTDPYLFPKFDPPYAHEETQYEKDLETLLVGCGATSIIYCAKDVKNRPLYQRIKNSLLKKGITITHTSKLERCHDRFWYCPETEKCICFGTSLNGIGKAICQINELDSNDVATLKSYFVKAGII